MSIEPQQVEPQQIEPQQVGPQQVGPQQVGPQQVGPQQVEPQQVGPQQVEPQQVEPQQVEPPYGEHSTASETKLTRAANDLIIGMSRHWLAIFNTVWAIYLFTPFLAPVFMHLGWESPAGIIYTIYSVLCHQLPDHSYFLFGPSLTPLTPELVAGGMPIVDSLFIERAFIGNAEIGWKVALCQRDVAIYSGVLLAGLSYALVRRRARPLPLKVFVLLALPMAIDGGTQLIGLRESNWILRTVTGMLFGMAAIYLAYPYVQEAMDEVRETELQRRAVLQQHGSAPQT